MGFWLFMLVMDLLIPAVMIGFGFRFTHNPPREINSVYGYRTTRSMCNMDTWIFAHHYCGKLWFVTGLIMLIPTVAAMLLVFGASVDTIGKWGGIVCFVQMIPLIASLIVTERALHKTFDGNGLRRK